MEVIHSVGTVQIGTEFYRLVRIEGEHPRVAWEETFEDEAAFQGGTPDILSAPADTWHMGGFKSREGFPGTSEYGQNTDGRWPNKLIPGPKWSAITLTDSDAPPTFFFEALGELFVCAGYRVYHIDPSDDSVTLSEEFNQYLLAPEGLNWDTGQAIIGTYNSEGKVCKLYRLTQLGSPDSWGSGTAEAWRLAAGLDRLFKVNRTGVLKSCLTGLDPTDEDNWADEVQCGDATFPTALVAYERTALVGKSDGLFGVDEEGKGIPLIRRMPPDAGNCLGMYVVEPYVLVPHERGCFRFMPGWVEAAGLEREILNESSVRGFFRALASDGKWLYAVTNIGANSYVMVGRDAIEEEGSLGPYIWDTLSYAASKVSHAIHVSRLWDPPRMFIGYGNDVAYSKLSAGGGAPDPEGSDYRFVTSGTRYTHRYHFGDWKNKDFLRVKGVGKGCDANTYWIIWYSVDGGAYAKVDIDGVEMRVDENKLHTFTLPLAAKGMEVQFKLEYVGASDSAMGQLAHFKPYAVPTSLKLRHYNLTLLLADELRHEIGVEQRSSVTQLNDLYALTESSAGVDCKGPWGDITVHPRRMRMLETRQEGHKPPQFVVELVAQRRETS